MYQDNGKVLYRGSFLQGQKEGRGKYYDESGGVILDGQFQSDAFVTGYARLSDEEGGLLYEGYMTDGAYDGEGTLYESGSPVYDGEWKAGAYDGEGTRSRKAV